MESDRRDFLKKIGLGAAGYSLAGAVPAGVINNFIQNKTFFDISLAEFSFASELWTGKMTNLDFPAKAKKGSKLRIKTLLSQEVNGIVGKLQLDSTLRNKFFQPVQLYVHNGADLFFQQWLEHDDLVHPI